MKTTLTSETTQDAEDDLRPEYRFDYRTARPNRFAGQIEKSQVVVMLDPDISQVFTTADSVNAVLRALISTMPPTQPKPGHKSLPKSARKSALR